MGIATRFLGSSGVGELSLGGEGLSVPSSSILTLRSNGGGATATINVPEGTTLVTVIESHGGIAPRTYSKSGDDAGKFTLNADTGELTFTVAKNYEAPDDADTDGTYLVTVTVTDVLAATDSQDLTIILTNVNEAPTDIALSENEVQEASPIGTTIGTFSSTDQDSGDTFTYTLVTGDGDTDNDSFTIDGAALKAAIEIGVATTSYGIRVRTTDAGGLYFEKAFEITSISASSPKVFTLVLDDLLTRFVEGPTGASTIYFRLVTAEASTPQMYLDVGGGSGVIKDVNTLASEIEAQIEGTDPRYVGNVTVSGESMEAGDKYTFTISFDASLGAVTLDFGTSQWYPTITLTEAVTQQGQAEVTGVAEVSRLSFGDTENDNGTSTFVIGGFDGSCDLLVGVITAVTPPTGQTVTAGGVGDISVDFTADTAGAISNISLTGGPGTESTEVEGVDAVTGQPEIHTITPSPTNPTGGTLSINGNVLSYDASVEDIRTAVNTIFGWSPSDAIGTFDAGAVSVESNNFADLGDTDIAPVNIDLTAPEITHSIT